MMAPFLGSTSGDKNHSQNVDRQPRAQQLTNYSIHISRTLLDFLLIDCYRPSPVKGINILTADLLGVSLAHADYSASLTELLDNLFSHIRRGITDIKLMWVIAPHVSDYLEVRPVFKCTILVKHWSNHLSAACLLGGSSTVGPTGGPGAEQCMEAIVRK